MLKTTPHFWNLNEDSQLSRKVIHFIKAGNFQLFDAGNSFSQVLFRTVFTSPLRLASIPHVKYFTPVFRTIYPRSWNVFRSAPCALSFLMQATTARSKRQASPLFMTGERLYRLIFLTTLFLTLITSSQVCSHLKLSTIGSCAAIKSLTCQCARLIVLKNLLLLAIA